MQVQFLRAQLLPGVVQLTSTVGDVDDDELGNGRVLDAQMARAHQHLLLRESVPVVFERDEQRRGDSVLRLYPSLPLSVGSRGHDVLDTRRRIGLAELLEQRLLGAGGFAVQYDPVADGRVDDSPPLAVHDHAALILREDACDGRCEEAHAATRPTPPYDVVAAPPGADDAAPGRLHLVAEHAPQHAEGQHAAAGREHVRPNQPVDERVFDRARRQVVLWAALVDHG